MTEERHIVRERSISADAYCCSDYETRRRFSNYFYQIKEISDSDPINILDIGIGSRFLAEYLKRRGGACMTMDINEHLGPDVVGSIDTIPFASNSFDTVSAFEVCEHLPLHRLPRMLSELWRVAQRACILSVPNCTPAYPLQITLPRVGALRWIVELHRRAGMWAPNQHEWEIGHGDASLRNIRDLIIEGGFRIERDYRVFENPYCHMFVLRKSNR